MLAALACFSATEPAGPVTARATAQGILVANGTARPIFYMAVEEGTMALIDWIPCSDATRCPSIGPGAETSLAWDRVVGYDPNLHTYVLTWWQGPNTDADVQSGRVVVHR